MRPRIAFGELTASARLQLSYNRKLNAQELAARVLPRWSHCYSYTLGGRINARRSRAKMSN